MPFSGIGFYEMLVIGVVILLVVGPQKLPEIARQAGKGMRMLRRASQELRDSLDVDEIKRTVYDEPMRELKRQAQEIVDVEPEPVEVRAPSTAGVESPGQDTRHPAQTDGADVLAANAPPVEPADAVGDHPAAPTPEAAPMAEAPDTAPAAPAPPPPAGPRATVARADPFAPAPAADGDDDGQPAT
jgi:sec-independent protein translocase protein TatB